MEKKILVELVAHDLEWGIHPRMQQYSITVVGEKGEHIHTSYVWKCLDCDYMEEEALRVAVNWDKIEHYPAMKKAVLEYRKEPEQEVKKDGTD